MPIHGGSKLQSHSDFPCYGCPVAAAFVLHGFHWVGGTLGSFVCPSGLLAPVPLVMVILPAGKALISQAEDRADDEGFPQCGLLDLGAGPQNLAEVVDGLDAGKDHHVLDFRYMLVHM